VSLPAAVPAGQQRQEAAPDQRSVTQKLLATQADRLRDKGRLAAAAATTPAEQKKAEMLLELADKSRAAAEKMAEPPAAPQGGTLMAEPFLAALRAHAAAKGAALPDDVVQSAWDAAVKATASVQRPAAQSVAATPKGPKKERVERHAQQEQVHRPQQSNTPSTPGRR
jgi:hypothetical protein